MSSQTRFVVVVVLALLGASVSRSSLAIEFIPDAIYTTSYFSRTILQYDDSGAVVDSLEVSPGEADSLKGLAFGPDGLLYVTAVRGFGFVVLALDESGAVHARYPGNVYVQGNLSYGKLAVDEERLYVAGQDLLTRFELGDPGSATSIYNANQVYDVEILSNGNLLVASAYRVAEISSDGQLVRHVGPSFPFNFTDIRGVEYDEVTDKIFVTHLGHSNFFFRLMRLDGATGTLEDDVVFTYADDLFVMSTGDVLVGSRTEPPRIYDQSLQLVAELGGSERMFVTQYTLPDSSLELAIDIKPGSEINSINPASRGVIPVAILGSEALDVADIDVSTLGFGPGLAPVAHRRGGHPADVNLDEWPDLLVHFDTEEAAIALGDTEACVVGDTLTGVQVAGCDAIQTVPECGRGFEAALLALPLVVRRRRRQSS